MAKKPVAKYEPGELGRVRKRLGELSPQEAKRMAEKLGGEVFAERASGPPKPYRPAKSEGEEASKGAIIAQNPEEEWRRRAERARGALPEEPSQKRVQYGERVKMDRLAAQPEYYIKSPGMMVASFFSFLFSPPDLVNPDFTMVRLNEIFRRLESFVVATRQLSRSRVADFQERFKSEKPFYDRVIALISAWDLETLHKELAYLQRNPRSATVESCSTLVRELLRPTILLSELNPERHIALALDAVYRFQLAEDQAHAREQILPKLRIAQEHLSFVFVTMPHYLYPLTLKLCSDRFLPYELLFSDNRERLLGFMRVDERRILQRPPKSKESEKKIDVSAPASQEGESEVEIVAPNKDAEPKVAIDGEIRTEIPNVILKSFENLERLFPKAGWQALPSYFDLYPYFKSIMGFPGSFALISPQDPMQQISVFIFLLRQLFFGFHSISLGIGRGDGDKPENYALSLAAIVDRWHRYEELATKDYLSLLNEYCRMIEISHESRGSGFAKKIEGDLFWLKKLYFLPNLSTTSILQSKVPKNPDAFSLARDVADLKRMFRQVALDIDAAMKKQAGGEAPPCETIDNPWEPFVFEVPNAISRRLSLLYGGDKSPGKQTNAALVYFTLSVVILLDYIVNDPASWANRPCNAVEFRSLNGEGLVPLYGVETDIDPDTLFKLSLRQ